jgi:uncharacterized cupredoxin-like copper-binding protein
MRPSTEERHPGGTEVETIRMNITRGAVGRLLGLTAALVLGVATVPLAAYAQAGAITVDLAEFSIKASPATAPAGTVNFAAKNGGANNHEIVVVRSSAAPGALALNATNAVDEAQIQIVGRMPRVAGGASGTLAVDLTPGAYILLCNIGTHYQRGMAMAFTVTGAAAAPGAVAAPKAGTGGYLADNAASMWVLGALAVVAGTIALGARLTARREQ